MTLKERIRNAQNGYTQELFRLVQEFGPLLKTFSRKLNDEDTYAELRFKLIETILKLKVENLRTTSDPTILSYLKKSIMHYYVFLMKQEMLNSMIYPISALKDYPDNDDSAVFDGSTPPQIGNHNFDDIDFLHSYLTSYEATIIFAVYYYKYTLTELASYFGVTLSAVSQARSNAVRKLRKAMLP